MSPSEKEESEAKERLERCINSARKSWIDSCGLKGRWLDSNFDNFKRELSPKAFDIFKEFSVQNRKSILLRSDNYGVGKTHLVAALVNRLNNSVIPVFFQPDSYAIGYRRMPALFLTETNLLIRIRQTFNRQDEEEDTEEDVYCDLRNTPLLIIDDVGKTKPRDYSFLQSVYFRIIDERYTDESPMILTTNLTLSELETHIGGASADRLREMCGKNGFITISAKSYRR